MKKACYFFLHVLVIIVFTLLSQVGGLLYLMVVFIKRKWHLTLLSSFLLFAISYLAFSLILLPLTAPMFDRYALPYSGNLVPRNYLTCLLNRHYVKEELRKVLTSSSRKLESRHAGYKVLYLDANFPFPGLPLLPHLSHSDGEKVDLAFIYKKNGVVANSSPSSFGYGYCEEPVEGEIDYPEKCKNDGFTFYNSTKNLFPAFQKDKYALDLKATQFLIREICQNKSVSKAFLEPHLKMRWGLSNLNKVRFQGCHAVRHDDHIHIQL